MLKKIMIIILIISISLFMFADEDFQKNDYYNYIEGNDEAFLQDNPKREESKPESELGTVTLDKMLYFATGGLSLVGLQTVYWWYINKYVNGGDPNGLYYMVGLFLAIPLILILTGLAIYKLKYKTMIKGKAELDALKAKKEAKSYSKSFCYGSLTAFVIEGEIIFDFIILMAIVFTIWPIQFGT